MHLTPQPQSVGSLRLPPAASRSVWLAQLAVALVIAAQVAWHAQHRTAFNLNTETDYVAGFHMEAARFLAGEPLLVRFHPPGYPAVLAAVHGLTGDWFTTGLAVSVVSAAAAVLVSLVFWRRLAGPAAGWGVLAAWAVSLCFLHYAVQATSDVFGIAVYQSIWLAALCAWQKPAWWRWAILGGLLGFGLLARSDVIVTAPLVALPLLSGGSWRTRAGRIAIILAVAALPMAAWLSYARATQSPPWPTMTYANVALTYFADGEDNISGDAREPLDVKFQRLGEVLGCDPARMATQYVRDVALLPAHIVRHVTWWPLAVVGVLGLWLLVRRSARPFIWVFGVLTLGHVLMVNLKAFEPRYYLFTLPWLGAGAGVLAAAAVGRVPRPRVRTVAWAACGLGLAALSYRLGHTGYWDSETRWYQPEVLAAADALRHHSQPGDVICARKPHLAYYTGQRIERSFPIVTDMPSLHDALVEVRQRDPGAEVFLFFGSLERSTRAALIQLATPGDHTPWLTPVAQGDGPNTWVLYRFTPATPPGPMP